MPFANGMYSSIFDDGTLSQPPLILLHGAGSNRLCWPAAIRRLPGHKVIALDLPGHGRSEGVALQSVSEYAEAVLDFMREMGFYTASLVGHSLGGAISLQIALHHPDRVARLGVFAGGAALNIPQEVLSSFSNPATFKEGMENLEELLFGPSADANLKTKVLGTLRELRQSVLYGDWLACADFDIRETVQQIETPALVITGDHDKLAPPFQSRFLAEQMKYAELKLVPGAGHMLILEAPQVVSGYLVKFMQEI